MLILVWSFFYQRVLVTVVDNWVLSLQVQADLCACEVSLFERTLWTPSLLLSTAPRRDSDTMMLIVFVGHRAPSAGVYAGFTSPAAVAVHRLAKQPASLGQPKVVLKAVRTNCLHTPWRIWTGRPGPFRGCRREGPGMKWMVLLWSMHMRLA